MDNPGGSPTHSEIDQDSGCFDSTVHPLTGTIHFISNHQREILNIWGWTPHGEYLVTVHRETVLIVFIKQMEYIYRNRTYDELVALCCGSDDTRCCPLGYALRDSVFVDRG